MNRRLATHARILRPPLAEGQIRLPDGRRLGYAEFGDPRGAPVFFFHGLPGSRFQRHPDDGVAAALGVRLITCDRPGFGQSDAQPRRTMLTWAEDIVHLADARGIGRFALFGVSAGGPYAAACAFAIPHRLRRVAIISGVAPPPLTKNETAEMLWLNRLAFALARRAPWGLTPPLHIIAYLARRRPEHYLALLRRTLKGNDPDLLSRSEIDAMFRQELEQAFCRGTSAFIQDLGVIARPWGFRLEDIRLPLHLWHGEADRIVPAAAGRRIAVAIPDCRALFLPGEGHYLVLSRWRDILRQLTAENG
ncbi:MAG TPA: alpha/beta hydrolase [Betaproteobacteria bacterium]|nr:alpha/beta hydrolase [Betaproteobacteria bacterium]